MKLMHALLIGCMAISMTTIFADHVATQDQEAAQDKCGCGGPKPQPQPQPQQPTQPANQ